MSLSGGSSPRTPWDDIPEPERIPVGLDRPVVPEHSLRAEPDFFAHLEPDYFAHVEPDATVEEEPKRRSRRRKVLEVGIVLLVAGLIAFGLRAVVFEAFYVPSTSMLPTIQPGDRILVDRLFFHPSSLRTGDIIVFHTPPAAKARCETNDPDLVKRVIGLPGELIYSVDNTVYIDRAPLAEPFLKSGTALGPAIGSPSQPVVVPKDDYFVLGDNRAISCDSRYFGFVQAKAIIGKVVALIWRNNHPAFHAY